MSTLFGPEPRKRGWRSPGLPWVIIGWLAFAYVFYVIQPVFFIFVILFLIPPFLGILFQLAHGGLSSRRTFALWMCLLVMASLVLVALLHPTANHFD